MINNKIELLAPCGNLAILKTAIDSGADSVYLGLKEFSARASAENFTLDELEELGGHLKTEHGFIINPLRTVFYGLCTDCANKKDTENE